MRKWWSGWRGISRGLLSYGLTPSGEEEREQLQRGADRLRRAAGKVLPSVEGRVAALLKGLLECTVDIYEGLLKVCMRFFVYSTFVSDAPSLVERSYCCNRR
jgi:hypothetical protein